MPIELHEGFSQPASSLRSKEKRPGRKSLLTWGVLALGVCGLLLLSLWDCAPQPPAVPQSPDADTALTGSLEMLVSAISGDPDPVVALTFTQSESYDYAYEEKTSSGSSERRVALYEDGEGHDRGILKTAYPPRVAGVAVVCTDGDSVAVRSRVIEAVSTALQLSTDKVYVTAKRTG